MSEPLSIDERMECMRAMGRKWATPIFEPKTVLRYEATCKALEAQLAEERQVCETVQRCWDQLAADAVRVERHLLALLARAEEALGEGHLRSQIRAALADPRCSAARLERALHEAEDEARRLRAVLERIRDCGNAVLEGKEPPHE